MNIKYDAVLGQLREKDTSTVSATGSSFNTSGANITYAGSFIGGIGSLTGSSFAGRFIGDGGGLTNLPAGGSSFNTSGANITYAGSFLGGIGSLSGDLQANHIGLTGSINISGNIALTKADPEIRLTDTGDNEYARITRSDTNKEMLLLNRVNSLGGVAYALDCDGTGDYMSAGGTTTYQGLSALTLAAWVYIDNKTDYDGIISCHSADSKGFALDLRLAASNTFGGFVYSSTGTNLSYGTANNDALANSGWHLIGLTWNGATGAMKFYVDGAENGTATQQTGTGTTTQTATLRIGDSPGAGSRDVDGRIDEPLIWSRVLSLAEFQTLYNSGSGVRGETSSAPWSTNLVGGWHLDEGTGTNADDFSAGNNDGTITNAVWIAGKVSFPISVIETQILSSQNGVAAGEEGINAFGDSLGKTIIQGNPIVTSSVFNASGLSVLGSVTFNASGLAAGSQTLISLPLSIFGSGTIQDLLGDPRVWLNVTINGVAYKIPAF